MTFLTIDEINSNSIYNPPASWINGKLPFLEELNTKKICYIQPYHKKRENEICLIRRGCSNKNFKKFVYVNLPCNSKHKGCGAKNSGKIFNRFDNNYYDYKDLENTLHTNNFEDRFSLKKADLIEWLEMNNIKVKKSLKLNDIVDVIRNNIY